MRLDWEYIEVEGFRSIREPLYFDVSLLEHGLHYLRGRNDAEPALGSNGAGKTSLLHALCWCLFGVTPSTWTAAGLRNPDVHSWGRGAKTKVRVGVVIDNQQHTVTRSISPNRLLFDDKVVTQDRIDEELGMHFGLFTNTVLLGQGSPLFLDLEPRRKLELFVTALRLERWDQWSAQAKAQAVQGDGQLVRLRQELTICETELVSVDRQLVEYQTRSDSWSAQNQQRLTDLQAELGSYEKQLARLQPRHDKATMQLDSAGMELKPLQDELKGHETDLRALERNQIQFETQVQFAQQSLHELQLQLRSLDKLDTCPTCKQPIKPRNLEGHRRELQKQVASYEKQIKDGVPPRTQQKLQQVREVVAALRASMEQFQVTADEARVELDLVGPQIALLRAQIDQTKKGVADAKAETNPYHELRAAARKRKAELTRQIAAHNKHSAELELLVARTRYWEPGFKEVRLFLLQEVLQDLEFATNVALPEVGLHDWSIRYDIERETKAGTVQSGLIVTVLSPYNDGPVRWEVWSGGEGQRLRIVAALALADILLGYVGVEAGFEILDEPTSHMMRTRELCAYLQARAWQQSKRCLFVDHRSIESRWFDSVITIVKDSRGSRLEYLQ